MSQIRRTSSYFAAFPFAGCSQTCCGDSLLLFEWILPLKCLKIFTFSRSALWLLEVWRKIPLKTSRWTTDQCLYLNCRGIFLLHYVLLTPDRVKRGKSRNLLGTFVCWSPSGVENTTCTTPLNSCHPFLLRSVAICRRGLIPTARTDWQVNCCQRARLPCQRPGTAELFFMQTFLCHMK